MKKFLISFLNALINTIFDIEMFQKLVAGAARVTVFVCLECIIVTQEPLASDFKFWCVMGLVLWNFDIPKVKVTVNDNRSTPEH